MKSYYETLISTAKDANVSLAQAFGFGGVPSSTYYRTLHGAELRFETAEKVMKAIEKLSALQRHRADLANIRKNGGNPRKFAK